MVAIMKEEPTIAFRFLEPNEYSKVQHIYNELNAELPNSGLSRIRVAELDDKIIALATWELRPHSAMWIDPKYKGTKIWLKLASDINELASRADTYIEATTEETVRMCEALGLEMLLCPVYVKRKSQGE
jgi:hypothetical protein